MGIPHTDENKLWLDIQNLIGSIASTIDNNVIWVETTDNSFKDYVSDNLITCRLHILFKVTDSEHHYPCVINTKQKFIFFNSHEYSIKDNLNLIPLLTTIDKLRNYNRIYFI